MKMRKKEVGKFKVFCFSLDPKTIELVDKIIDAKEFDNRSSFVELILRTHVMEVIKNGKI